MSSTCYEFTKCNAQPQITLNNMTWSPWQQSTAIYRDEKRPRPARMKVKKKREGMKNRETRLDVSIRQQMMHGHQAPPLLIAFMTNSSRVMNFHNRSGCAPNRNSILAFWPFNLQLTLPTLCANHRGMPTF